MANTIVSSSLSLDTLTQEQINYDPKQFEELCEGTLIGNYRLVRCLGNGGMGQAWLAEQMDGENVSQKVVCKFINEKLRDDKEKMETIAEVFNLTKDLHQTNICGILAMLTGTQWGTVLVMKYANGGTLADWAKENRGDDGCVSLEKVLSVIRPIAEALDYAHKHDVVHRDVKPENIMFMNSDSTPQPVLIDFGLAVRARWDSAPNNMSLGNCQLANSSSGTPCYMAPEQWAGTPQSGRTDQYALALVIYELLTGKNPFRGKTLLNIAMNIKSFDPKHDAFTPEMYHAVKRALANEPEDRFSSCVEFINALDPKSGTFQDWVRPSLPSIPDTPPVTAQDWSWDESEFQKTADKTLEKIEEELKAYEKLLIDYSPESDTARAQFARLNAVVEHYILCVEEWYGTYARIEQDMLSKGIREISPILAGHRTKKNNVLARTKGFSTQKLPKTTVEIVKLLEDVYAERHRNKQKEEERIRQQKVEEWREWWENLFSCWKNLLINRVLPLVLWLVSGALMIVGFFMASVGWDESSPLVCCGGFILGFLGTLLFGSFTVVFAEEFKSH